MIERRCKMDMVYVGVFALFAVMIVVAVMAVALIAMAAKKPKKGGNVDDEKMFHDIIHFFEGKGAFGEVILAIVKNHGGKITFVGFFFAVPAMIRLLEEHATMWFAAQPMVIQFLVGAVLTVVPAFTIVTVLWMWAILND